MICCLVVTLGVSVAQFGLRISTGTPVTDGLDTNYVVTGRVTDAHSGKPVSGAFVSSGGQGTSTDGDGLYSLVIPLRGSGTRNEGVTAARYWEYEPAAKSFTVESACVILQDMQLKPVSDPEVSWLYNEYKPGKSAYRWSSPFPSESEEPRQRTGPGAVGGYVFDASNGDILPGARVWLSGSPDTAVGSVRGSYVLRAEPGEVLLSASYIGYESAQVSAHVKAGDTVGLHISLPPRWDAYTRPDTYRRRSEPLADSEPLFPAPTNLGWYGYIDREGHVVIEPRFAKALKFSEGLAWVRDNWWGCPTWGAVDRNGTYAFHSRRYANVQQYSSGLAAFKQESVFGYVDRVGREVVSCRFKQAHDFSEGLARVLVDSLYGWIDKDGLMVIAPTYYQARDFSEGLAVVRREMNGKWGYIDRHGNEVIPLILNSASDFKHSLARVYRPGYDFIDRTGQPICARLHDAAEFSEGLAAVAPKVGLWGYMDTLGQMVIQPQFRKALSFSCGRAAVMNATYRWGYIDRAGRLVIEPRYRECSSFADGLARVMTDTGFHRWRFIDTTGRTVTTLKEWAGGFSSGYAMYGSGSHTFIDRHGRTLTNRRFTEADDFVGNHAPVTDSGGAGWIDRSGRLQLDSSFEKTRAFSEGLAPVMVERRWGFADTTGRIVVPCRYNKVGPFSEGLAVVGAGSRWGFVDRFGNTAIEPQYDSVGRFCAGLAPVSVTPARWTSGRSIGKWGYIDRTGRMVVSPRFAMATEFADGVAMVAALDSASTRSDPILVYGFMDTTGEYVTPRVFPGARPFSEGTAAVGVSVADSVRWGYIDRTGRFVMEPLFADAGPFSDGLAAVVVNADQWQRKQVCIDTVGNVMFDASGSWLGRFSNGLAVAQDYAGWFVDGHRRLPWENPDYRVFLDRTGHVAFPLNLGRAEDFEDGLARVVWRNRARYIDQRGRFVW